MHSMFIQTNWRKPLYTFSWLTSIIIYRKTNEMPRFTIQKSKIQSSFHRHRMPTPSTSVGPTPQAVKVTTTTTTTTGCGSSSCSRNGDGDKGSNYSCKNIHQRSVSPLSEVCRCADVAIILPNKAESHSVALPRNKKRTTTEDWRHLLQERWRVWGGRGVTHTELRSH